MDLSHLMIDPQLYVTNHSYPSIRAYFAGDKRPKPRSDCDHGCGAWMGFTNSGGPPGVDPFGMCPNVVVNQYPRHQHDCDRCYFVGHHGDYDMWYHVNPGSNDDCIVRFGSDGENYGSLGLDIVKSVGPTQTGAKYYAVFRAARDLGISR